MTTHEERQEVSMAIAALRVSAAMLRVEANTLRAQGRAGAADADDGQARLNDRAADRLTAVFGVDEFGATTKTGGAP